MTDAEQQELSFLAKMVIVIGIALVVAGVVWHGVTIAVFQRIWANLVERPTEQMKFRFMLQPVMAAVAAILAGLKDARTGRSPYFWTMLDDPSERAGRLREGLNATARIILLGLVMDAIYQLIVLKQFYPAEAVIIALLLAFAPYVVLRGPVARQRLCA